MSRSPLLCIPQYKERIWGGRNLERVLGRQLPHGISVGESWEVSSLPDSPTRIENGGYETLTDAIHDDPTGILGVTGYPADSGPPLFPLLVKFLDANELLSVQVHPDDAYARVHENGSPGKSEMWLILEAEDGAELIAGLAPGVTRESFSEAVRAGHVSETLRRHPVHAGDVFLMPAGRVHALGSGIVALEIQQTSDATYRLYDWDRVGDDGAPRDLHVDRAMDVIRFDDTADPGVTPVERHESWGIRKLLGATPHFVTESLNPDADVTVSMYPGSPDVLVGLSSSFIVEYQEGTLRVPSGRTAVIPASVASYRILPEGDGTIVRSYVPDFATGLRDWQPMDAHERDMIRGVCSEDARSLVK